MRVKSYVFQFRRGTSSEWLLDNPVLRAGEIGFSIDAHLFKIGDGVLSWMALPYFVDHEKIAEMIADAVIDGVPGPPGEPGIQGLKGDTGSQGIQGIQGIQGLKGDTGNTGAAGTSYTGPMISVASTAPSSPSTGDVWIDTSS